MARRFTFALGLAAAVSVLLRAVTGCGTSNNLAGSPDAGEEATGHDAGPGADAGDGGFVPNGCNAGCLCYGVDACPAGCYPSVTEEPDGSGSEPFCSNGIVQCVAGGFSWSLGAPVNNCPGGPSTYLDSGPAPDGSFCCDYHQDAGAEADAADAFDGDAGSGGNSNTNSSACATAGGQCVLSESFCAVPGTAACGPSPIATFCCLHVGGSCGQPAVTTFSAACEGGPPVCQGTPRPVLSDIPADAGVVDEYPDASFAAGCTVSYPLCGFDGVYTCTCGEPEGSQGWTCIL